ncbi:MAG: hypothetical protein HY678_00810 [Chloroflexi bacterium]|nr:hypothetical protein [Chloroflexota bacterium]
MSSDGPLSTPGLILLGVGLWGADRLVVAGLLRESERTPTAIRVVDLVRRFDRLAGARLEDGAVRVMAAVAQAAVERQGGSGR